MDTLIQANIFFFITSVVTVVLAIGVAILLFYIIRITRNVDYISKKLKDESDNVTADIALLRARIKEEGVKVAPIIGLFSRFFGGSKKEAHKSSHRRKHAKHESSKEHEDTSQE